jgi:outer membrane protein assembly factor BamE (lipoprotein component of BamABCDE complex)
MMQRMSIVVLSGMAMMGLTACAADLQTASPSPQGREQRLTLGAVQQEIRKGTSSAAVAEALGSPNIVTTDAQGREVWIYDRIATERIQEVNFAGLLLIGHSREAGAVSQQSLTVIVKFDADKRVRDYAYRAARF